MPPERDPTLDAEHFVYVIGIDNGPHKIGIAKDVEARLLGLQNGNPFRLHIRYKLTTTFGLAWEIEQIAHHLLRRRRMMGEWFSADAASCEKIVDRAAELVAQGRSIFEVKAAQVTQQFEEEQAQRQRAKRMRPPKPAPYDPLGAHRYRKNQA